MSVLYPAWAGQERPYAAPLRATDTVRVEARGGELEVHATKRISAADPYLPAHFPGLVVYPGVFVLETVCQAVRTALGARDGRDANLSAVRSMRFLAALRPGDQLAVVARIGPAQRPDAVVVRVRCTDDEGSEVARMVLEFGYQAGVDA